MYFYKVYGQVIKTDMEFVQLVAGEETEEVDVTVVEGISDEWVQKMDAFHAQCKYTEFGQSLSWFCNSYCYFLIENGKTIHYKLKLAGTKMMLRNFILGYGMSMVALQKGILAIHCSAVANDKGALFIAGESGAGKSTVTTSFLENGYRLMSDDIAWVRKLEDGRVLAYPAFPYQKLCRNVAVEKGYDFNEMIYVDEDKDKFLVPFKGKYSTDPVELKGFIYINVINDEELSAVEVKGLDVFYVIANNLFLRHLLGMDKYKPEIGQKCLEIASKVPVGMVSRPNKKDTTEEVVSKAFEFANKWF